MAFNYGSFGREKTSFQIPAYILDDLSSRFIINIPDDERTDLIRIFFQVELAHWFYLDFYCADNAALKNCSIKDFSFQMFCHCPTLSNYAKNFGQILDTWREYKMSVPTYGAILMDEKMNHCLLVQGFWSKASWGFPKGKVNQGETPKECANREVLEETGFDMSELINDSEYIEYQLNEQHSRLYLVPGVSMETKFQPRTRKEIKNLSWFRIDCLPIHKKDTTCHFYGLQPNAFFMVIPFMRPLRKWINKKLNRQVYPVEKPRVERPRRSSYNERPLKDRLEWVNSSHHGKPRPEMKPPTASRVLTFDPPGRGVSHTHSPRSQPEKLPVSPARGGVLILGVGGRGGGQAHSPRSQTQDSTRKSFKPQPAPAVAAAVAATVASTVTDQPKQVFKLPRSSTWDNFTFDMDAILEPLKPKKKPHRTTYKSSHYKPQQDKPTQYHSQPGHYQHSYQHS